MVLPRQIMALRDVVIERCACGWDHSLAVSADGDLYTWGAGMNGKLGHGDEENVSVPQKIAYFSSAGIKVAIVDAGCEHSVAISTKGELFTWGHGDSGRLGHGDSASERTPKRVESLVQEGLHAVNLAVGDKYNMVLVQERGGVENPDDHEADSRSVVRERETKSTVECANKSATAAFLREWDDETSSQTCKSLPLTSIALVVLSKIANLDAAVDATVSTKTTAGSKTTYSYVTHVFPSKQILLPKYKDAARSQHCEREDVRQRQPGTVSFDYCVDTSEDTFRMLGSILGHSWGQVSCKNVPAGDSAIWHAILWQSLRILHSNVVELGKCGKIAACHVVDGEHTVSSALPRALKVIRSILLEIVDSGDRLGGVDDSANTPQSRLGCHAVSSTDSIVRTDNFGWILHILPNSSGKDRATIRFCLQQIFAKRKLLPRATRLLAARNNVS